ncbi:MAG: hypothetical protein A3C53_08245 [Omnitrophica WOR_2 bacterium RIFCSPHIGHO2_02_FULL_68_15]|nr:MAG: hypothetical protein A3C53_08245 [Omnitrophica WOR_2 bacterium RIFCSPHIGHO2_02_FULL_68_15]
MFYHPDVMPPSTAGVTVIPLQAEAADARAQLVAADLNPLAAIASALDSRLLRARPETILRTGLEGRTVFSTQY